MRTLIRMLILSTVAVAATGCILVPVGGYHHGGGYYDRDDCGGHRR